MSFATPVRCPGPAPVRAAPQARRGSRAGTCLLALACTLLSGCGTPYLLQAARGQMQVMHKRVPIDTLLADPHTSPVLRTHLEAVRAARSFATQVRVLPVLVRPGLESEVSLRLIPI